MKYFVGDIITHPMIKEVVFLVKGITADAYGDYGTLLCSKSGGESGITKIHTSNQNITLKWRLPENRAGENS